MRDEDGTAHSIYEDVDRAGLGKDERRFIARGLVYDIIGESSTLQGALLNFVLAVNAEFDFAARDGRQFCEGLSRTPLQFVRWFEERTSEDSTA